MSTKETDLYWEKQGVIYQEFCDFVDLNGWAKGLKALDDLEDADPRTYEKCKDYIWGDDHYEEDLIDQAKEREAERIDMYFAPAEGLKE